MRLGLMQVVPTSRSAKTTIGKRMTLCGQGIMSDHERCPFILVQQLAAQTYTALPGSESR